MNEFWQYQFQSGITLTLLFGIYWFLLRKETFFRLHRFFLLAAGIISLVLPLINFSILMGVKSFSPVQIVNSGYRYVETALVMNPVKITGEQQGGFTVYQFILGVYLTGIFLLSGRLVYQAIMITKSIRQSETRILRDIPVNVSNRIPAPFSFFGRIFIPFGILKHKHFEEILIHEAEHLKQKHSWDLLFIELLCVFQWFNPIVWMVGRAVRETHEFLADQGVLRQGTIRTSYQAVLLEHTLGVPVFGLSHYFNNSISKKRMIMMKKRKSPNRRKWRMLFLIPVVVLLNLAFSNPFSGGSIFEDQIVLTENNPVKGKVTAEDTGKPLPGVNIIIKGTSAGTITDINGEFSLDIEEENITLFVAFMGYETLVAEAKKGEFLNIVLKRNIETPDNLNPNENIKISSVYQDKASLFFVNEKEITNEEMKQLDRDNIQSLTVLKGESAKKKYGERAKDGVIIITLKDYLSTNSNKKYLVKGKVFDDSTGEPLPGASIVISNTYTGTITDKNGEFSLQADNEIISFSVSYIGFKTVIVKVVSDKYLEIRLKKDVYKLRLEQPKSKDNKEPAKPDKPVGNDQDEIFFIVEDVPHFPGGIQALQEYLASNTHYPKEAKEEGISGTVWVRFTVDEDGIIKNIMLDKNIYPSLDKEALRVISSMPEWKPGEQRGKAVPVELVIPVEFKILIDEVPARKILK